MVEPSRPWDARIGPPEASDAGAHDAEPRHLALWLLPREPLDLFGRGPIACGDLDPGTARTALHLTLASGSRTWAAGRAGLARAGAALAKAGQFPVRAELSAVRTSALPRMRTFVQLAFEQDPRELATRAFDDALVSESWTGMGGTSRGKVPSTLKQDIPPHLTLSYLREHTCSELVLRTVLLDTLWLVDLGDGEVLDTLRWRRVPME